MVIYCMSIKKIVFKMNESTEQGQVMYCQVHT